MIFKGFFRRRRLRKDASPVATEFLPLGSIRSVAVIIDGAASGAVDCAVAMEEYCRQHGMQLRLLYVDLRKFNSKYPLLTDPLKTVLKRDLNWFGKPNLHKSAEVLAEPSDLFISLYYSDIYCVRYFASSAKARFKIGLMEYSGDPFNFIVSPSSSEGEPIDAVAVFRKITDMIATVR